MSNQIEIKQRIRSIAIQLENGNGNAEIIAHCAALWRVSPRTVERYIALAKDVIAERLDNEDAIIEAFRGSLIAEEAEKNLRSNLELEARVVAIIEGELETEKVVTRNANGEWETKTKPSRNTLLKAIDMIWKHRRQHSGKQKPETPQMPAMPLIVVENEEAKKIVEDIIKLP